MPRTAKDNSRFTTMPVEQLQGLLSKSLAGASHMLETASEEASNDSPDLTYIATLTRMVRANTLRADVICRELSSRG